MGITGRFIFCRNQLLPMGFAEFIALIPPRVSALNFSKRTAHLTADQLSSTGRWLSVVVIRDASTSNYDEQRTIGHQVVRS